MQVLGEGEKAKKKFPLAIILILKSFTSTNLACTMSYGEKKRGSSTQINLICRLIRDITEISLTHSSELFIITTTI